MASVLTSYQTTLQNNASGTGNGTAMSVGGLAAVIVQLETWGSATITWEALVNDTGGNYTAVLGLNLNTGIWSTTATAAGLYYVPVSGASLFRGRISAYVSGTTNTATALAVPSGVAPPYGTLAGLTKVNTGNALLVAAHNSDKATYLASFNVSATASVDLFAIESGASKIVRIRRIVIVNPGAQTGAALRSLQLMRTTVAGTGSTLTPSPTDSADSAFSGIVRSGNTGANLGTAGTVLVTIPILVPATIAVSLPLVFDFDGPNAKPPTGSAGSANGLSLRDPGAAGGVTITGFVVWTEESA